MNSAFEIVILTVVSVWIPLASATQLPPAVSPTVEISPGVRMPVINVGTWSLGNGKPSDPSIGVPAWLNAGGRGYCYTLVLILFA